MIDTNLLNQFVTSFHKFDDMVVCGDVLSELDAGTDDSPWARQKWRPAQIATDSAAMVQLYNQLPGRFPPLFEQLLLSYRWLEVDLNGFVKLFANPPGLTLLAFADNVTRDPILCEVLFPLGLIPFGKAGDDSYDPLCFDTRRRRADGDCPIVRIEHESILCDLKLGQAWQVAPAFRRFIQSVIRQGHKK